MGAQSVYETVCIHGKMSDAYRQAKDEAREEYGHQQGYSGTIQDVEFPTEYKSKLARFNSRKFFEQIENILEDTPKRDCWYIQLSGAAAKRVKEAHGYKNRKGINVYYFFGVAPY